MIQPAAAPDANRAIASAENAAENVTCTNCGQALFEARIAWQMEGQEPQSLPLNRTLSIGRVPGNDIVISDTAMSRQHARVVVSDEGISLVDLGSLNGTFINGERVNEERFLADGDVIRVGRALLTVSLVAVAPAEPEAIPESEATVALWLWRLEFSRCPQALQVWLLYFGSTKTTGIPAASAL